MILPIVAYGNPILRMIAKKIEPDHPDIKELVEDMFETMYHSNGLGLAAPQIDQSLQLFVIDADVLKEDYPEAEGFKRVVINPEILEESEEEWEFDEGCLSLPGINEVVIRPSAIKVRYFDQDFNEIIEDLDGITARVFQHEFDHLQGKVFTDRLSTIRKTFLKKQLNNISSGNVETKYRMKINRRRKA